MATSCCTCMAWGIVPPRASVAMLTPRAFVVRLVHVPVGVRLLVQGGDISCEAETCRARRRLVVHDGDFSCEVETYHARRRLVVGIPLVENWSEMQPIGQGLDVLPVWVLTRVLSPPCPESLP
jgi:hypothetical protein